MGVNICDTDSLSKILAVEVPPPAASTASDFAATDKSLSYLERLAEFMQFTTSGDQSFSLAVRKYRELLRRIEKAPTMGDADRMRQRYSAVIYGVGGNNRYYVDMAGEISFSKSHSNDAGVARAVAQGFNIES